MKRNLPFSFLQVFVAAMFAFPSGSVLAGIVVFEDRANFDSVVASRAGAVQTEGFNSNFQPASLVDFGPFSIQTDSPTGLGPSSAKSEGSGAAAFQSAGPPTSATINFDQPINTFAIDLVDWASSSLNFGNSILPQTLSITNDTGTVKEVLGITFDPLPDQNNIFFGVISDQTFSSLTISSSTFADSIGLDDMDFGFTAVPEPTSLILVGIPGLAMVLRRKRNSANR